MLRPSTSRGWPAFGCAESLRRVTASMRSMVSSIGAGPTAQLTPMMVAPRCSSAGANFSGGVARDPRPLFVDRVQLVGEAERPELDAVRAERVGLDDVGARAHVLLVHFGHQIGLGDVQRVEALVDEDAFGVEHRAHRPVTDQYALFERVEKRFHVSSRSVLNVSPSTSKYDLVTMSRPIERTPWRTESVNS